MCESERYRVGYALQPKKVESFIQPSLLDNARQQGIDLVEIDPSKPLEEQGPFHCIIHKLHTQHWKKHLQQFSTKSPNTVIIDPPELVDRLHNRLSMLDAVNQLQISLQNATVEVPKQVLVNEPKAWDKIQELGLRFPVIAKPLAADGGAGSHELCLVFDGEGLNALSFPTVLQEFVNHGGVVFKIYVAGQSVNCVKRKSLADICEERLKILKGALPFSRVSEEDGSGGGVENAEMLPQSLVSELAMKLREALGLNLFNVDVIRDGKEPTSCYGDVKCIASICSDNWIGSRVFASIKRCDPTKTFVDKFGGFMNETSIDYEELKIVEYGWCSSSRPRLSG